MVVQRAVTELLSAPGGSKEGRWRGRAVKRKSGRETGKRREYKEEITERRGVERNRNSGQ